MQGIRKQVGAYTALCGFALAACTSPEYGAICTKSVPPGMYEALDIGCDRTIDGLVGTGNVLIALDTTSTKEIQLNFLQRRTAVLGGSEIGV